MTLFSFSQRVAARFSRPVDVPPPAGRGLSLKKAFDAAGVGMATATVDGHWLYLNDTCCQLLGYTRDELLRFSLNDLTHPEDASKELALIRRVLAGDSRRYRLEKRLIDKKGQYRTLQVSAALVSGTGADPDVFVYVIEPQGTPAASGQDAGRLAVTILERLPNVAVIRTDTRGMITGWNNGAERMLGHRRDEIIGKNRRVLYRDQDSWEDRPAVHLRLAAEHGHLTNDDFRVGRDGAHLWVHSEISSYAPDGTVRGFVEVLSPQEGSSTAMDLGPAVEHLQRELTQERAAAAALREEVQQLNLRDESRDQELHTLAGSLQKELDRRLEAEQALRQLLAEAEPAPVAEAKGGMATLELETEPSWIELGNASPMDLLLEAAVERRTGTLIVAEAQFHKAIFFENGRLTSIASNDPADFLGERLVRTGAITEAQRTKARQLVDATGLAYGRCVVLLGMMSDADARAAMRAKIEDEVEVLAGWTHCLWSFVSRELPHRKMLKLSIDVHEFRAVRAAVEVVSPSVASVPGAMTAQVPVAPPNLKEEEALYLLLHSESVRASHGLETAGVEPQAASEPQRYVATKRGARFHRESCTTVRRIAAEQRLEIDPPGAAARGLAPCQVCLP
jgi:PAS domain S-box-containing protein